MIAKAFPSIPMDCSICLAAIETGTSSATTACGHAFHFGCLATWSRTKSTCPLCRQAFTETDTPAPVDLSRYLTIESSRVTPADIESFRRQTRRDLRRDLQDRYMLRPLEWAVFEGPDPVQIAFVIQKTGMDLESAKAYLAFYKDPVELVINTWDGEKLPIPEFRRRDRGRAEPYVSRDTRDRDGVTVLTSQMHLHEGGYESA